jgi:O-antigen/teichoic acid export membrane protein
MCSGLVRLVASVLVVSDSSGLGLWALASILVVTSWLQAGVLSWLAAMHLRLSEFHFDAGFCWRQLVAGFPFVPITLFIALETQLGGILLSAFHSEEMVGAYGMANVIISGIALLSHAFRVGVFPVMARLYQVERSRFVRLYELSWRYLSIVSFPAVVLVVMLSNRIIRLVYQRTPAQAIATLQWLAPTLLFYFLSIPNARLMILENRQRILARFLGIGVVANIAVCLLLIPRYGSVAVAVARVASMCALLLLNSAYVYRRILPVRPWRLVWQSLTASATMALVVLIMYESADYVRGFSGLVVYGILLICLKAIPPSDWLWLRQRLPRRYGQSTPKRQLDGESGCHRD